LGEREVIEIANRRVKTLFFLSSQKRREKRGKTAKLNCWKKKKEKTGIGKVCCPFYKKKKKYLSFCVRASRKKNAKSTQNKCTTTGQSHKRSLKNFTLSSARACECFLDNCFFNKLS
jgi:hypothetical protein